MQIYCIRVGRKLGPYYMPFLDVEVYLLRHIVEHVPAVFTFDTMTSGGVTSENKFVVKGEISESRIKPEFHVTWSATSRPLVPNAPHPMSLRNGEIKPT